MSIWVSFLVNFRLTFNSCNQKGLGISFSLICFLLNLYGLLSARICPGNMSASGRMKTLSLSLRNLEYSGRGMTGPQTEWQNALDKYEKPGMWEAKEGHLVRVFQTDRVNKDLWRKSHLSWDSYQNPMLGTSSGFLQGLFGILPHLFFPPMGSMDPNSNGDWLGKELLSSRNMQHQK